MTLKEELIKTAQNLIDVKSQIDDIKAGKDLIEIQDMIIGIKNGFRTMAEGMNLHNRLFCDYETIRNLYTLINAVQQTGEVVPSSNAIVTAEQKLCEHLKADEYGILTEVLVKHGQISDIHEFIENIQ